MSTLGKRSSMWSTTAVLGTLGFAFVMGYLGAAVAADAARGATYRVVVAGILFLIAAASAMTGIAEMRAARSGSSAGSKG